MRPWQPVLVLISAGLVTQACGSTAGSGGGGGVIDAVDGTSQDGTAHDGTAQDGTAHDGTAHDGTAGTDATVEDAGGTADGAGGETIEDTGSDIAVVDAEDGDGGDGDEVDDGQTIEDTNGGTDDEGDGTIEDFGGDGATESGSDVAEDVDAAPDATDAGGEVEGETSPDGGVDASPAVMGVTALKAGQLVITEILADSTAVADELGEWLEIHNTASVAFDLRGLLIEDKNAKPHEITGDKPIVIAAGGYALLCANGDKATNGGVDCLYDYQDKVKLTNSADTAKLSVGGTVIDQVDYANAGDKGWPTLLKGHSQQLDPGKVNATDNDAGVHWCIPQATFGAGDFGSPGQANPACPADQDKDGIVDSADNCVSISNPSQFDEDTDGVGSSCDNCPKVANKEQTDTDKDGVGDACPGAVCGNAKLEEGEDCDDGGKVDGDGCSATCKKEASKIGAGDLVITELLIDAVKVADEKGEYVEIYNATDGPITLDGVVIQNKTIKHTIAPATKLVVPAKGYVVLGPNADTATNGGVKVDYVWKQVALGNSGSDLALVAGEVVIDKVVWPGSGSNGWPKYKDGASIQLSSSQLTAALNDDGKHWCPSTTETTAGDKGTPGKANLDCSAQ